MKPKLGREIWGMKAFFLIDSPLAGEIAYSVADQLSQESKRCQIIAFLMKPDDFHEKFQPTLDKLTQASNITVASEKDYPKCGRVKILRTIKPDIYITTGDADFVIAAKHLNLPTLRIPLGITGEFPFNWRNLKVVASLFTKFSRIPNEYSRIWETLGETGQNPLHRSYFIFKHLWIRFRRKYRIQCDKVAVSGDFTRELFIKQGKPPDEIVVTGLPRLDSLASESSTKDEFTLQLELLKRDKKIVLYLPDVAAKHKMVSYKAELDTTCQVINSCQEFPEVLLVIKPHPGEAPEFYSSIVSNLKSDALVYKGVNLHDLIRTSDVVITGISGTGLETLALHRPLININLHTRGGYFPYKWELIPYISSGVAFGVHHLEELSGIIKTALYNNEEREKLMARSSDFVYQHLYKLDGKASERVADLILEMTNGRSEGTTHHV